MKIGFIGAGKVGFSLGKYFSLNKQNLTGYFSNNTESAKEAAIFTSSNYYNNLKEIVDESDIIFITTQDSFIKEVWDSIKNLNIKNKIICHCSGSLSSDIFSNIENHNAYGYSIHPMFAISDKYNSYKDLNKAFISIEGAPKYLDYFKDMFESIGNQVKIITKENKSIYHTASVIVSNQVIALASTGVDLLKTCGFNEKEAMDALYPLMFNNLKNIGSSGIVNSLTGPIERADLSTIERHLACLNGDDKELYKLLSKKLINIAKVKNRDKDYSYLEKMIGE